jgi:hypothetical protein
MQMIRRGQFVILETASGEVKKPPPKPSGTIARRPPTRPTKKQVQLGIGFLKP